MSTQRPYPRRPPWLYPTGTRIFLRDGRVFMVVAPSQRQWDDPTEGNGGGNWITVMGTRRWREA